MHRQQHLRDACGSDADAALPEKQHGERRVRLRSLERSNARVGALRSGRRERGALLHESPGRSIGERDLDLVGEPCCTCTATDATDATGTPTASNSRASISRYLLYTCTATATDTDATDPSIIYSRALFIAYLALLTFYILLIHYLVSSKHRTDQLLSIYLLCFVRNFSHPIL